MLLSPKQIHFMIVSYKCGVLFCLPLCKQKMISSKNVTRNEDMYFTLKIYLYDKQYSSNTSSLELYTILQPYDTIKIQKLQ